MIRIHSITIKEFRGIRDLPLECNGKNFAVSGPNGTGKSGVVDALEFVLTGQVSRLAGEGKGDVSLKVHGPHVDSRNAPEKASVAAKIEIPSLGKTVTISRSVKSPGELRVDSRDPAVLSVLKQVETHPEFVLSRRELIRYVLATPGKRAEEVQALLHLTTVEEVRATLLRIANACARQVPGLETIAKQAQDGLRKALGLTDLTKDKALAAVNSQRLILGLVALPEWTDSVSVKDGMAVSASGQSQRIPKKQALLDITDARAELRKVSDPGFVEKIGTVQADMRALAEDPVVARGIEREDFYRTGLGLIEETACPFCDETWNLDELKKHVREKVAHLKAIAEKRRTIEGNLAPITGALATVERAVDLLVDYGRKAQPALAMKAAGEYVSAVQNGAKCIAAFLPINEAIMALGTVPEVPQAVRDSITELESYVSGLPEPSTQEGAREWLTIVHERLIAHRDAQSKLARAKQQADRTKIVSDTYAAASDAVLTRIYAGVEKDFADLYRVINRVDESAFTATLTPSMGKLGFDVDFYGRGKFPPGAYHSEGHQDGMGLCLYLALMRHLQRDRFTFAVLDDVLMSVDTGHRREVCALLKTEFPNTQFVITTHDRIWLRHMKTESLIGSKAAVEFKNWTVEQGPAAWNDRDVWTEIDEHLNKNDVRTAAGLLRNYLEFISAELCHRLRAQVEFRGDAQYQLGELLPRASAALRKLYSTAKAAASSWKQAENVKALDEADKRLAGLVAASRVEQWQTNTAIHFNSWENFGKSDFEPVAAAFRSLLGAFACHTCGELLRVTPERETADSLRCDCGKSVINLRKKE